MSLATLFHFLCAQHVLDFNLVVLFLVRCVLEFRCGWVGVVSVLQTGAVQYGHHSNPTFDPS